MEGDPRDADGPVGKKGKCNGKICTENAMTRKKWIDFQEKVCYNILC